MAWQRVCPSTQLSEGQAIEVVLDGNVIAIFRSEGVLSALDGMCAHQGGPLARGHVANGRVTCPWHGWQYELQNGNNAVTCKPMQRTYPVNEMDGWIQIELAK
ncbi:MAG: Rieske (2Fe-2S) protein [Pirellulaceae bacterium]|nr:Rieske (2Fe-2S) protein [Pirellulaceae bacterium]